MLSIIFKVKLSEVLLLLALPAQQSVHRTVVHIPEKGSKRWILRSHAIANLRNLKFPDLKQRYRELFGEASKSSNKQFLFRRIAWRLQANAEGGLSERARRRAADIANESDARSPGVPTRTAVGYMGFMR